MAEIAATAGPTAGPTTPDSAAMALALLARGVPLSLLLDLAGPLHSRDIYREEIGDTRWVPSALA